ncbi:MAG TPA: hypothetical protein VD788_13325 [Candidatus Polarisedimenticolaceae bacterium]|nr:hypothetical protein [Candidatus Polarisedimenticolaceae bacterium]
MPRDPEAIVRAYSRKIDRLIRRGERLTEDDARRLRRLFVAFRAQALARLPVVSQLNRAAIAGVIGALDAQLQVLADQVHDLVEAGTAAQLDLAREMTRVYGETFVDELDLDAVMRQFSGARLSALDAVSGFSAELIGVSSGGLRADILSEVNREIRLSALGAGEGTFAGTVAVERALSGVAKWTARAERIYRTETLRAHSIVTEQTIRELNRYSPTRKRWNWSGISRREHAAIDGQTIEVGGRYRVPLRDGGTVLMRWPRDPSAPASATINCGCYETPVPAESTARRAA